MRQADHRQSKSFSGGESLPATNELGCVSATRVYRDKGPTCVKLITVRLNPSQVESDL
jgi:hypothetical protein